MKSGVATHPVIESGAPHPDILIHASMRLKLNYSRCSRWNCFLLVCYGGRVGEIPKYLRSASPIEESALYLYFQIQNAIKLDQKLGFVL